MIYVLHHRDSDGFGAAWAVSRRLGFDDIEYIDVDYDEPLPELEHRATVYIFDFTPKDVDAIKRLCAAHELVIVVDHHISAKEWCDKHESELPQNFLPSYNMDKSGAVLAWELFHPTEKVPLILQHVQDFDLNKLELDGTLEVAALLFSVGFNFEAWDEINGELGHFIAENDIYKKGNAILTYEEKLVDMIAGQATMVTGHEGIRFVEVNCTSNWSTVGAKLLKDYPEAQYVDMWSVAASGNTRHSLRSRKNEFDVRKLAEKFKGGGGHPTAAGYRV